ncbi:MAG TPA: type II toxin-antitoxin system VapB family antitoxin [Spirochaetota bacterium]|jgi:Arc/MetJ family transcription regulator|nr:type II toxin-antitoxin system VapB family antitoxin [Spirochaetota bacterium]HPJ14344.1 type II toxin-antitoxin system VapB family antitoxin [Spirochaetota bacterium]HPW51544.1 type II toxin-antitoxin system VapB family antitoxin [Spirochaetota bacterium]HPY02989.1 type II toxin-antitoxin system VapB family antitoxin [Spirochaetota bacterium]HQA52543.1 type II toxin-antitoxin system VapB family antitoxin [Spirochaetota bacterium]
MATNLNIDNTLLEEAFKIGKFRSKKETVNIALKEYIQRKKQKNILKYFNSIDFDSAFDYKASRK